MFEVRWSIKPDLWIRLLVLERVVDCSVSTISVFDIADILISQINKKLSHEESLVESV